MEPKVPRRIRNRPSHVDAVHSGLTRGEPERQVPASTVQVKKPGAVRNGTRHPSFQLLILSVMNLAKPARSMRGIEDPPNRALRKDFEFDFGPAVARGPVLIYRQSPSLFPDCV